MTDPDRPPRTPEPAEGGDPPGTESDGRTPRSEEPAEGKEMGEGPADTPG
jgi:hypothetical protein